MNFLPSRYPAGSDRLSPRAFRPATPGFTGSEAPPSACLLMKRFRRLLAPLLALFVALPGLYSVAQDNPAPAAVPTPQSQ